MPDTRHMTKFLARKVALASFVVVAAVATAPAAQAYGPNRDCHYAAKQRDVGANSGSPHRVYAVGPIDRRWWYLETNDLPGLQRNDHQCENPGGNHDTVIASTRIICTCDYPFGDYPPLSLAEPVVEETDSVMWTVIYQAWLVRDTVWSLLEGLPLP